MCPLKLCDKTKQNKKITTYSSMSLKVKDGNVSITHTGCLLTEEDTKQLLVGKKNTNAETRQDQVQLLCR